MAEYSAQLRRPLGGRLYYGWIVVAITFLTLMVAAGVRSSPGVFIYPIEVEMGWDRAAISMAASIGILLFGLSGPFTGRLLDRFGARRVMLFGVAIGGLGTGVGAAVQELWQLDLAWGVLSGLGTGATASVLGVAVANRWFVARRGFVLGLFGAAFSAGQLVFLPTLMWLVVSIGWRGATLVIAVIALFLLVPIALLMRSDPADIGLRPYGHTVPTQVDRGAGPSMGQVVRHTVRSRQFWLLAGTFGICGATTNGLIGTHLIPHSIDRGIPEVTAAGAMALMGSVNFLGALASGWLTDRVDPRKLLACYYATRGLSLFFLPFVGDFPSLALFGVFYGLEYAATLPATASLAGTIFGTRNVATVFGLVSLAHQTGAALAAYLGGVAHLALGDYQLSFFAAGLLGLIASLMALGIDRDRRSVLATEPALAIRTS